MKTWMITGASRGLGRGFVEAALHRGDQVAATSRDTKALAPLHEQYPGTLLPLALDVADAGAVAEATKAVTDKFGRLDDAAGQAMLKIVDATEPPVRIFLGKAAPAWISFLYQERLKTWKDWEHISTAAGLGEEMPH